MKYCVLINKDNHKRVYSTDKIRDEQIFQLVGHIQKTLHQSETNELIDEELIAFAENNLGVELNLVKIVAEINVSRPLRDW